MQIYELNYKSDYQVLKHQVTIKNVMKSTCELVGLFILNDICNEYGKHNIGLYRDDGLAIFKNISGPQAQGTNTERHHKTLQDTDKHENRQLPGRHL